MKKLTYAIVTLFLVLPLLAVLYLSVVTQWSFPALWDAEFTLRGWSHVFRSGDGLGNSLLLSLFISSLIASLATVFGFMASKELMFTPRFTRLLSLAYYPYLIAPVVLGSMLQYYFIRLGLSGSLGGVLLAQGLFIVPYSVLLLSTFWNERIRQTAFQASTLGASTRQLFVTILIPMARPWLILCYAQCFLISWFEYGITQVIGVGKVPTLTIRTMQFVREADPHQAARAAGLMVLPVILLLIVNQRLFIQRAEVA